MGTPDLDAIRDLFRRYAGATWDDDDGLARDLADEVPALVAEVERLHANQADAVASALEDMAERIDRGPAIPLPPSVYSALIRERADDVRAAVSTGDGTGDTDEGD